MTTNMFHDPERLSGVDIDQLPDRLRGDLVPIFINKVTGMDQELRLGELKFAGFPKVLPNLGLQFRKLPPCLHGLAIEAERRDAGTDIVLITILRHQGELSGDDGHYSLLRDGIAVVGYSSASRMVLRLKDILPKTIPRYVEECRL